MSPTREFPREKPLHDGSLTAAERLVRIQALSAKLADLTVLNTPTIRARSIRIADELVSLLVREDEYQRSLTVSASDTHEAAPKQLAEAPRECREPREHSDPPPLYIVGERLQEEA